MVTHDWWLGRVHLRMALMILSVLVMWRIGCYGSCGGGIVVRMGQVVSIDFQWASIGVVHFTLLIQWSMRLRSTFTWLMIVGSVSWLGSPVSYAWYVFIDDRVTMIVSLLVRAHRLSWSCAGTWWWDRVMLGECRDGWSGLLVCSSLWFWIGLTKIVSSMSRVRIDLVIYGPNHFTKFTTTVI